MPGRRNLGNFLTRGDNFYFILFFVTLGFFLFILFFFFFILSGVCEGWEGLGASEMSGKSEEGRSLSFYSLFSF